MTNAEKQQSNNVFVGAGRKAYLMLIHLQNNPYKDQPYRDLWDKGYRLERRRVEGPRPGTRPTTTQPQSQAPRPAIVPRRPYQGRAGYVPNTHERNQSQSPRPQIGRPAPQAPIARTELPALNLGRIARFNAKYRTAV